MSVRMQNDGWIFSVWSLNLQLTSRQWVNQAGIFRHNLWPTTKHFATSKPSSILHLVQQKNLFQDVAGKELTSNVAYHSWRGKKTRRVYLQTLSHTVMGPIQTLSAAYCVSVRSSRAWFVMCSRNRFFWREWSLTRQFSARRSDTGEWSITVNFPLLKEADGTKEKWDGRRKGR